MVSQMKALEDKSQRMKRIFADLNMQVNKVRSLTKRIGDDGVIIL